MISIDISAPPPAIGDQALAGPPPSNAPSSAPPFQPRYGHNFRFRPPFRPQHNNQLLNSLPDDFDGKRLRKSNMRKTVDYNTAVVRMLENRVWQRDYRDRHALQPDVLYIPELLPPTAYKENPTNSVTTRFVKTATNKMRCPIFCMAWTPEGRRLVTGASSGEFTLWNGLTFNFETILQAHDSPVRSMVWNNSDSWMITGDHAGYCKYWQSNMNNVRMFQAHKEAIRGLSFCPTDQKIVSCSDDGTLRIWDFQTCQEERVLRGHGADVKCCNWHPHRALIASGSKDNQQPIKLWDPKSGNSITTLHAHKSTVMDLKWNRNGNWFITASRDHFLKLFDLRNLGQPVQTFRGHKKEASCIAWHPQHEGLLASGGSDGTILFWHVGADKEVGSIDSAHDSIVWTLDWHPLGHILASGSNDHTTKFWTRNRPGDKMRDKYNLNLGHHNSLNDDGDIHEEAIPGMAPEDRVEQSSVMDTSQFTFSSSEAKIPGLEESEASSSVRKSDHKHNTSKKPYAFAKPIPKNFVNSWNETNLPPPIVEPLVIPEPVQIAPPASTHDDEEEYEGYGTDSILEPISLICNKIIEAQPGVKRVEELEPDGVIAYGRVIPVKQGSKMFRKIRRGYGSLQSYLTSGKVKELKDLPGFWELEQIHESNTDSSSDDEGFGRYPTKEELGVDRLDLEEYLKPFTGFKEADLDDLPFRDKEGRDVPRGFGRDEDERERDKRDNEDNFHRRDRDEWASPGGRGPWENRERDAPPNLRVPNNSPWAQPPQNFGGPPNMMNPYMMMNMRPNFGPNMMGNYQGMMGSNNGPNGNNFDRQRMNDGDVDMDVDRNRWENRKRNFDESNNGGEDEWRRNEWERGNNFNRDQGGFMRRGRGGRPPLPPRRGARGGRYMN